MIYLRPLTQLQRQDFLRSTTTENEDVGKGNSNQLGKIRRNQWYSCPRSPPRRVILCRGQIDFIETDRLRHSRHRVRDTLVHLPSVSSQEC